MKTVVVVSKSDKKVLLASSLAGGAIIGQIQTAKAQAAPTDPVASVTAMVTNLGTITGAVVAILVGAMGVRMAVKQVNRLMTKG